MGGLDQFSQMRTVILQRKLEFHQQLRGQNDRMTALEQLLDDFALPVDYTFALAHMALSHFQRGFRVSHTPV